MIELSGPVAPRSHHQHHPSGNTLLMRAYDCTRVCVCVRVAVILWLATRDRHQRDSGNRMVM